MRRWKLHYDLPLMLVVCGVGIAANTSEVLARIAGGAQGTVSPYLLLLVVAYTLFEGARHARPLSGLFVGTLGLLSIGVPYAIGEMLYFKYPGAELESMARLGLMAGAGAATGLVAASGGWLVRRLRRLGPAETRQEPGEPLAGWLLVLVVALAVLLLGDSVAWGSETSTRWIFGQMVESLHLWPGWNAFHRFGRMLLVVLGSVAVYAAARRRRWARPAVAGYFAAGLVIVMARAWFLFSAELAMPPLEFGAMPASSPGLDCFVLAASVPGVPFEALVSWNLVDAGVRLLACAVGIPYIIRSERARRAFGRRTADPSRYQRR